MNTRSPFSRKQIILLSAAAWLPAVAVFAQDNSSMSNASDTYFSNPLFLVLLFAIIMLLGIAFALGNMVKSAAFFNLKDQAKNKQEETKPDFVPVWEFSASKLFLLAIIGIFFGSIPYWAKGVFRAKPADAAIEQASTIGSLGQGIFWSMVAIIVIELLVIALLYGSGIRLLRTERKKKTAPAAKKDRQAEEAQMPAFLERFNRSVAIEHEKDILLDHNYDGIRELDNNLPPWWKYGFYITIIWGVIYLVHFHVIKTGSLQEGEYLAQMAQAEADLAAYRKKAANFVDESNVTLLRNADSIAQGKSLFMSKQCVQCHGANGEGIVGPNLTDDYWLHGNDVKDIFKVIKFGVLGKGMKSWQNELSPSEMQMVTSYIKSIHGSNPPNPKAPEGTIYKEAGITAPPPDSAATATDSIPKADSAAKK